MLTHFSWRAPQLLNIADMGSKSLREKDATRRGRERERERQGCISSVFVNVRESESLVNGISPGRINGMVLY